MKIINLFSGPGAGKSTTMKMLTGHLRAEDQIYVFAKQQRRIARLRDHNLQWVITDSPIPLGLCYMKPEHETLAFRELVMHVFNSYDNHNFYLTRNVSYNPNGRNQKTISEAEQVDAKVLTMLSDNEIQHTHIQGGAQAVHDILAHVHLT